MGIILIEIDLTIGYTLTPDEMMPFQQAVFPLLIGSFIMIAGWSWPRVIADRYVEIQDSPAYSV